MVDVKTLHLNLHGLYFKWKLTITGDIDHDTLDDISKEHIADMIQEGFTQGELYQDDEWGEINAGEEKQESNRENDKVND